MSVPSRPTPPVRALVIGAGRHASASIWPLLAPAGLLPVGVVTRHPTHAAAAATAYGVPWADTELARALDETRPDAAIVVVDPGSYAPILGTLIERGVPTFAEKPAAADPREAAQLAALAERQRATVQVGWMKRYARAVRQASACIEDPSFGPITIAAFKWTVGPMRRGLLTVAQWAFDNPAHHVDLARHLVGELSDWQVLAATTAGQESALAVAARAEGGGVVTMALSSTGCWTQHNERVEVQGTGASVTVDNMDTCVLRPMNGPAQVWRPNYTVPTLDNTTGITQGFLAELQAFAGTVRDRAPVHSDLASNARTLAATEALVLAIDTTR